MNKISSILLLFGLSFNLVGQIEGFYDLQGPKGVDDNFCFDKGRFNYVWSGCLSTEKCLGDFKISGDTLILNSDFKLSDLVQLKQHSISKLDSVCISILTLSQSDPYATTLLINDSIKFDIKERRGQLLKFKKGYIKKLSAQADFVDWRTSKISFQINQESTLIEIVLDDTRGTQIAYFDNDKYIIDKNTLISTIDKRHIYIKSINKTCR